MGALLIGISPLLRRPWEGGIPLPCMEAALLLLAMITGRPEDVGEFRDPVERLLEETRGSQPKS